MSTAAKALLAWIVTGVIWDICRPDQTLSSAAARGLADERTRKPMAAALILVAIHLVVMARSVVTQSNPPVPDLDLERFRPLSNAGWM